MKKTTNRDVFVNCPFDEQYAPMLRAIVFSIIDCGFLPRCALEKSDASEVRIQKIYRIIQDCRYGIHDISRTELDYHSKLPRFNMSLELGIFLGAKFIGANDQRTKACLVFDQHPHRYQMYLSDVAGQDISWHSNEPKEVVRRMRDWFSSLVDTHIPTSGFVWDRYTTFLAELRHACSDLKQRADELTYLDLLRHIRDFQTAYAETLTIGVKDETIRNPRISDIRRAILSVGESDEDPFVILGKGASGYTYLQALRKANGRWIVEYQDGNLDKHYRAKRTLSTEEVVERFGRYKEASEDWGAGINWVPFETG
jgi:hypothetical protein